MRRDKNTKQQKFFLQRRRVLGVCGVVLGGVAWSMSVQAMTEAFTYTGVVVNPDGTQITSAQAACVRETATDTCDFRARLYTDATDGTLVWEDVLHNIELGDTGGTFTLTLDCGGDFAACREGDGPDFAEDALFVDVSFDPSGNADFVEGETFVPRAQLTAAPYAFHAQNADKVQGLEIDAFVRTDTDSTIDDDVTLHVHGDLNTNGDVSIADTQIALDGSVTDFAVTGDFSINNDDFFINKTTGFVGIGTRAPVGVAHVATARDVTALYVDSTHAGASTAPAFAVHVDDAADTFMAFTQGSDLFPRLSISAQGILGFGDGTVEADAQLYRSAPETLTTNGTFVVGDALGVGVAAPAYPIDTVSGAHLTVGGTWTNTSDANLKENFEDVDSAHILDKLAHLRITRWNYKSEDVDTVHIGPTAQDFFAAFGLGGSDTSISTIDPASVAIVGVQELYARDKERADALADVQDALADLEDDLADDVRAQIAQSGEDKDRKIAALESEIAQLKEYYTVLADAYIALDADQFSAVAVQTPQEEVAAAEEESSDTTPTVYGESIVAGEVVVAPDAAETRTIFVPFADAHAQQNIILSADAPTEQTGTESLTLSVHSIAENIGFTITVDGVLTTDTVIHWHVAQK